MFLASPPRYDCVLGSRRDHMMKSLFAVLALQVLGSPCFAAGISSKMSLARDESAELKTNSSEVSKEDNVEVKQTIIVTTKLNSNKPDNKRGFHRSASSTRDNVRPWNNGGTQTFVYTQGEKKKSDDYDDDDEDEDVPVVKGYKGASSTVINSPDTTLYKYPDSMVVVRNLPDESGYTGDWQGTSNWKPSNFFNNINWNRDSDFVSVNLPTSRGFNSRRREPYADWQQPPKPTANFRRMECCRCVTGGTVESRIVPNQRWKYETTTRVPISGKLPKAFSN